MVGTDLGGTIVASILPRVSGLRVLIVEDNPLVAGALANLLRRKGHHVQVTSSGEGALETVTSRAPDLALVDIGLPGIDGYEVARRLRERDAWRAVVLAAMTGCSDDDSRRQSEEAGFVAHLAKPLRFEELERVLERATHSIPGET